MEGSNTSKFCCEDSWELRNDEALAKHRKLTDLLTFYVTQQNTSLEINLLKLFKMLEQ